MTSAVRRGRIGVAAIFGGALRVWIRALPQLLFIAAVVHAPLVPLLFYVGSSPPPGSARGVTGRALPVFDFAVYAATEACAVGLVMRWLRGEPTRPMSSLRAGMRRVGTALGITAILNAPNGVYTALDVLSPEARPRAAPVGFPFPAGFSGWDLVVTLFTLFVSIFLCGTIPVALVEGRGVIASIGRSWILTRGSRLAITGAYAGFFGVAIAAAFLLSVVPLPDAGVAGIVLDVVGDIVVASFACIVPIVVFHELREAKEGAGGEQLVTVFK